MSLSPPSGSNLRRSDGELCPSLASVREILYNFLTQKFSSPNHDLRCIHQYQRSFESILVLLPCVYCAVHSPRLFYCSKPSIYSCMRFRRPWRACAYPNLAAAGGRHVSKTAQMSVGKGATPGPAQRLPAGYRTLLLSLYQLGHLRSVISTLIAADSIFRVPTPEAWLRPIPPCPCPG